MAQVVRVLDVTKSTYFPSFNRLCAEVSAARVEANNNVNYLAPLVRYLERLNMSDEFPALVEQFKPIMHLLLLVWKHSRYYNRCFAARSRAPCLPGRRAAER
jgi:dynein heavy chain